MDAIMDSTDWICCGVWVLVGMLFALALVWPVPPRSGPE